MTLHLLLRVIAIGKGIPTTTLSAVVEGAGVCLPVTTVTVNANRFRIATRRILFGKRDAIVTCSVATCYAVCGKVEGTANLCSIN